MPRLTEHFLEEIRGVVPPPVRNKFLEILRDVPELNPGQLINVARDIILPASVIAGLAFYDAAHLGEVKLSMHQHTKVRGDDGQDDPRWLVIKTVAAGVEHLAITGHDTLEAYFIAQRLIDEFGLPINNIPATETSTWGKRHLLIVGLDRLVKVGRSLIDTVKEGRDIGGEKVYFIGAHPGARFFSLSSRAILELEESDGEGLDGIEYDTTWGRRLGGFFSGTRKIYDRDLAGRIHATALINPDTHDDNPLRALTYIPKNMGPQEAIKGGYAISEVISLGGRPTLIGALRFATATGQDIPPWAAAKVKDALARRLSNRAKVRV
ncbi:hypothetical protein HYZ05_00515 [Candidatus Daviesbacteria bacterium]|nr:hypothetical protein [Candidatus Daviesbacteria bacterium]